MTRFLFSILVVLILWCPTSCIAGALNSIHIEENKESVTIQVDDATLGEVLQSIEDKTGIRFHVSPSVRDDLIKTDLNAPDWQTAMKLLLDAYARAELWGSRLDLTEIHILSRVDGTGVSSQSPGAGSPPMLSRKQLLKLVSGSYRGPLSPDLFDDPVIRSFLNQNGIQSLEDMKDSRKAKTVRVKARQQLRLIQKAR